MKISRKDIVIDGEITPYKDTDGSRYVEVYVETWFNIQEYFGVDLSQEDAWLNLYAFYDPEKREIVTEYIISTDHKEFDPVKFEFSDEEQELLMDMIEEKMQETSKMTCLQLIEEADEDGCL